MSAERELVGEPGYGMKSWDDICHECFEKLSGDEFVVSANVKK